MTPQELKDARRALGIGAKEFARIVRADPRTARRWETGERDIPAPVVVIVEIMQRFPEVRRWLVEEARAGAGPC